MRAAVGLTVVKIGGSYAFSTALKGWIDAISAGAGRVVVVPGGGPFAKTVRDAQPKMGFDDRAAHAMALFAMDQYGCALAALAARLRRADTVAASGARCAPARCRCGRPRGWCAMRRTLRGRGT